MQWQLGREMGTIPAFASRTQENQENLGRDGENLGRDGENLGLSPYICNFSPLGLSARVSSRFQMDYLLRTFTFYL